nr:transporter substrate-binding domain-containing protein [Desulfobulbaceae bacterium]
MKTAKTCILSLFVFVSQLVIHSPVTASEKTYIISYSSGTRFHELVRDRTKAVYDKAGIKAQFVVMPHKRSLSSANEGTSDGDVGRVPSVLERYPNLRRVNVKLMDLNGAVYTVRHDITSYNDAILKQYKVGHINGVQWTEEKMKGLEATKVDNYTILFEMLLQGRIDIALATDISAEETLAGMGEKGSEIHKLNPFVFSKPIHHYVNKKNESIIPQLERAARALHEEGYWKE